MKTVIVIAIAIGAAPIAVLVAFVFGAWVHRMGMQDGADLIDECGQEQPEPQPAPEPVSGGDGSLNGRKAPIELWLPGPCTQKSRKCTPLGDHVCGRKIRLPGTEQIDRCTRAPGHLGECCTCLIGDSTSTHNYAVGEGRA